MLPEIIVILAEKMASIDWNEHWTLNDESKGATEFAVEMADRLGRFIDERDIDNVADLGCGPATTLFELAGMYPRIDFYGFDIAESVIRKNKEKAEKDGLRNIFFETDELPDTRTLLRFDLVICFSTLHYIKDHGSALRSLFELVNPCGHLIFNYPSIHTKRSYEKDIHQGDKCMTKRFSILLSGDNVTSQREINRLLGVRPRKFYSSKIFNIYVRVRKPRSPFLVGHSPGVHRPGWRTAA